MKKTNLTLLIILLVIIAIVVIFIIPKTNKPTTDQTSASLLKEAVIKKDVSYCHKIVVIDSKDSEAQSNCYDFVAQISNNQQICEELSRINEHSIGVCYAVYAHYKKDPSLCVEPKCNKELFNFCEEKLCYTVEDYLLEN